MKKEKPRVLTDPTNRIVCVFESLNAASEARDQLIGYGIPPKQVKLLSGEKHASEMDTSAKWFADTDVEMKKFERELREGYVALACPVHNSETRESVNRVLQKQGARHVTHFGDLTTEVLR